MAAGGELIIDDKLVRAIHDMEKALQGVTKEADATQRKTMAWLSSLSSGNIDAFTNKIKQLESNYMNLVNALSNVQGFENLSEKALNTAGAITQLITVMGQNTPKKTDGFDSIRQTLDALLTQLAKARQDIDLYYQAIGTGKKEYIEFGQTGLKEAEARAESLMRKIEALNTTYQQLKQSSFNITDLTKGTMDDERSRIELSGIKMRLQEEERVHKAVMEHNLEELKAISDKIEAGIQGEKALAKAEEERHRKRQEYYNNVGKQWDIDDKAIRDAKYGDSSKGALNYSNRLYSTHGVRSIQNMETALNKLRDAQRRLNVGTEEGRKRYAELGAQIKKIEGDLNRVTNASERMKKSHSNLVNTGQQLARQLALVFSVSQIEGYINKIVQVRKEFELQQKSLQILVRDQSEANKIWTQTVQLAVKSPFRVKELVTYTKQLAAYRIETEKLHDTTRMLADVSAGLGVDMNRLILAYGQVRAAEFLRGTELRQFTEAGIPMLEELADHFSMLEGRAVSTADVFERISKRMVMFEDVNAVFKKMTSEGGTFYKMQEKQSETLYGTISNLHDSFDLMMNDIGKSNEGVIKRGLSLVKWLVEHWELVAEAVKATVAAFALYKIYVLQTKQALIDFAIANNIATGNKPLSMLNLLSIGWTKLAKSIKLAKAALLSNPITMIVLAAATAAYKLYDAWDLHNEKLKEATKLYRETRAEIAKIDTKFIYGDANERRQQLSALIGKATQFNIPIDFEVKNLSDEEVDAKFNSIRNQIDSTTAFIAEFNTALAKSDSWITPFDDLNDAFAETSKRASELFSLYERSRTSLISFLKENGKLTDDIKKQLAARGEYDKNETEIEYIERLNKAYDTYLNVVRLSNKAIAKMDVESARQTHQKWAQVWGDEMYNDIIKIRDTMLSYKNSLIDTNKEFEEFAKGLRIPPMSDEQRTVFIKTAIDEKGWDGFTTSLWYKLANERFSVNITPTIADKKDTEDWKKRVTAAVKKLNSKIKTELGDKTPETLFPLPSESDSQESWLNRYKEAIKEIKTVFLDGQELFDKSEVDDKNALKPYTREAEIIANIADKTTKAERDANTILNKRISLIKEIHNAYEKERKLWDESTSEERVLQSYMLAYEDAFGKSISGYNFKIKEGVSSELLELVPLAEKAGKEAMIALERAIASVEVESGDFKKNIADEELIRQVEDMFGTYELSLELKDMNIPTDIAEKLFGFETLDLKGLKEKLKELEPQFIGTDQEKKYRDYLQKVEEMEDKALKDRIKKFYKFLQDTTDAIQVAQQEGALDIQFATELFNSGKLTVEQYNQAVRKIIADTNKEISKLNLDKFKDSPEYIAAMGDMAGYTAMELTKLQNAIKNIIAKSSSTMQPEEIKAYNDALDKINDQLDRLKSPFAKTAISEIKEINRLNKELDAEKEKQQKLEQRRNDLEIQERELTSKLTNQKYHGAPQEEIDETISKIQETQEGIADINGDLNTTAGNIANIGNKLQKLYGGSSEGWAKANKALTETFRAIDGAVQIFNEVKDLAASFGADVDTGAWSDLSIIFSGIGEMSQKFQSGWQSFLSGDIVGGVAGFLGGVFSVIKLFNQLHDNKLEKQIKQQEHQVKLMGKAYEKLEKQMEGAYSTDSIKQNTDEMLKNLEEQAAANEKMAELEQAKKDTDKEKVEQYLEERDKALEEREKLLIEREKAFGGFGGQEDYKSASEEFVDAWLSAFKETGSGLKGLQEKFDEFFIDMIKKQLLNNVMEKSMTAFYDDWNAALADGRMDAQDAESLKQAWKNLQGELDSKLQAMTEVMGVADDIRGTAELGTLQKGIQGVTEDTAEIIASYLNAIRFMLGEQSSNIKSITDNYGNIEAPNTMLGQLKMIADNTRAINDLLGSVTKAGHREGGYGIKVFTD